MKKIKPNLNDTAQKTLPAPTKPALHIAHQRFPAGSLFPLPSQFPVLSAVCRLLCEELGKVVGIMTGVVEYGAHSGSGDIALETSASVNMATDYALTLTRNLTFIEGLLTGERLQLQKCDLSQLLMDTYTLNQRYLTHRQTFPSLVVDRSCMAEVDPNAVHHVVCTLLVRSGKHIEPGGTITVSLTQHKNHDVEISYAETLNPFPADLHDPELAVCKMLVEAHSGTFEVFTTEKERKFRLFFPAPDGQETEKLVNKRRHRRARVNFPVDIHIGPDLEEIHTHSLNLSMGGVMLSYVPEQFTTKPNVGEEVSLKIHCSRDRVLEIPRARIVTCLTHAVGLEFLEIDDKTQRILGGIVKSRPY